MEPLTPHPYVDLTLLSSIPGAQGATGGLFKNYQNCATKPEGLAASAQRTLPPALLPSCCACALEASQTRPRVPCGASARASRARARVLAAYNRGGVPLRRPVQFARRLSRSIGPTHLRRHRAGPAAGPGAEANLAESAAAGGGCCGGYEEAGGGGGGDSTTAKDEAIVRAPSVPTGSGGLRANRLGSKLPLGPGSGERPGRPSLPSGVAFAPVAMAPQGTGTSGSSSSAAASPSRTFQGCGGGGDPTTLPKSAGSPSSHAAGGGGARRTKREERGRRGGGLGAEGPRPGLDRLDVRPKSAASDWWSTSSFQYASGLAEPLGQATKWRRGRMSGEASRRALLVTARTEL